MRQTLITCRDKHTSAYPMLDGRTSLNLVLQTIKR